MKKLLFIIPILVLFMSVTKAQDKTVTTNLVYTAKGNTQDTLVANGNNLYNIYIKDYCETFKLAIKQTRTRGTRQKGLYLVQSSVDYVNWVTVASLPTYSTTATTVNIISGTLTPIAPYIRINATAGVADSTGVFRSTYYILIGKK